VRASAVVAVDMTSTMSRMLKRTSSEPPLIDLRARKADGRVTPQATLIRLMLASEHILPPHKAIWDAHWRDFSFLSFRCRVDMTVVM
jgi:hypothetical protein